MTGQQGLDENDHLELQFKFSTGDLAEDFRDQKDRPELTKLYNLLSDFGAQVHSYANFWKEDKDPVSKRLTAAIRNIPNAPEIKRTVKIMLPNDGNLKALWHNLTAPVFSAVIEPKSVEVGKGAITSFIGWIDTAVEGGVILDEQPEFWPPVFPPEKKGFHIT